MRRLTVQLTTAANGAAVGFTPRFSGLVQQIEYVKKDFADGVDFTITGEATAIGLWTEQNVNASAVRSPRQPAHTSAGAAVLYAAGGTAVTEKIGIGNDRVKIEVAQGGNAKGGTFHILVD